MKPDPYALIRSTLARRVGGTVIRPLPLTLRPILLDNRRRRVKLLSIKPTL